MRVDLGKSLALNQTRQISSLQTFLLASGAAPLERSLGWPDLLATNLTAHAALKLLTKDEGAALSHKSHV